MNKLSASLAPYLLVQIQGVLSHRISWCKWRIFKRFKQ